jgi:hypothetical protein
MTRRWYCPCTCEPLTAPPIMTMLPPQAAHTSTASLSISHISSHRQSTTGGAECGWRACPPWSVPTPFEVSVRPKSEAVTIVTFPQRLTSGRFIWAAARIRVRYLRTRENQSESHIVEDSQSKAACGRLGNTCQHVHLVDEGGERSVDLGEDQCHLVAEVRVLRSPRITSKNHPRRDSDRRQFSVIGYFTNRTRTHKYRVEVADLDHEHVALAAQLCTHRHDLGHLLELINTKHPKRMCQIVGNSQSADHIWRVKK